MEKRAGFNLRVSEDDSDVAYLKLPGHPGESSGVVKRTVSLRDLLANYEGPDLMFDFDDNNVLIGIEILG